MAKTTAKQEAPKPHSSLGASSAHRWIPCPGSVELCKSAPPQVDSEFAREGTAAHELGEKCLSKKEHMVGSQPEEYLGQTIQGFLVDQEMVDAVKLYVDTVRADHKTLGGALEVEKRISLESIHRGMFGTTDARVYARWNSLIVYDYKHGKGVAVDVVDNPQMLYYALGSYIELCNAMEFTEIELVIVQPRADHQDGPVRRWTVPVTFLTAFADRLREAALATMKPDAPLVPGKQCRWCPAQPICPAAAKHVMDVAVADFSGPITEKTLLAPEALTPEQLRKVLDNAGYIDSWIKAVEQYAEDCAKRGLVIQGYKLVKKRSTRKWLNEEEVVKTLKPKLGDQLFTAPELISPAQAEKLIGKKDGGKMMIETLSETPDTGVVLAPESDKRPAQAPPMLQDFA
jgi:hypothetical protein